MSRTRQILGFSTCLPRPRPSRPGLMPSRTTTCPGGVSAITITAYPPVLSRPSTPTRCRSSPTSPSCRRSSREVGGDRWPCSRPLARPPARRCLPGETSRSPRGGPEAEEVRPGEGRALMVELGDHLFRAGNLEPGAERYEQASDGRSEVGRPAGPAGPDRPGPGQVRRGGRRLCAGRGRRARLARPPPPRTSRPSSPSPATSPPARQAGDPPPGPPRRPRRLVRPRGRTVPLGPDPAGGRRLPAADRPPARPGPGRLPRRLAASERHRRTDPTERPQPHARDPPATTPPPARPTCLARPTATRSPTGSATCSGWSTARSSATPRSSTSSSSSSPSSPTPRRSTRRSRSCSTAWPCRSPTSRPTATPRRPRSGASTSRPGRSWRSTAMARRRSSTRPA